MAARLVPLIALTAMLAGTLGELSQGICSMPARAAASHDCCAATTDRLQAPCCHDRRRQRDTVLELLVRAAIDADTGARLPSSHGEAIDVRAADDVPPASSPPLIVLRI